VIPPIVTFLLLGGLIFTAAVVLRDLIRKIG
jgi:hypothetical protein